MTALYTERRADGWPMCPRCDSDELYSLSAPPTEATILGCYFCGWRPPAERWRDEIAAPQRGGFGSTGT